jgi:hypothetical protein
MYFLTNTYLKQQLLMQACFALFISGMVRSSGFYIHPEDMPDAEDFDEDDTWEEGLTEFDRQRHVSQEDDMDLIEDEDDSFVDELDEEE